jgi:hypothetical protein
LHGAGLIYQKDKAGRVRPTDLCRVRHLVFTSREFQADGRSQSWLRQHL